MNSIEGEWLQWPGRLTPELCNRQLGPIECIGRCKSDRSKLLVAKGLILNGRWCNRPHWPWRWKHTRDNGAGAFWRGCGRAPRNVRRVQDCIVREGRDR